jgi:hypothetical protein
MYCASFFASLSVLFLAAIHRPRKKSVPSSLQSFSLLINQSINQIKSTQTHSFIQLYNNNMSSINISSLSPPSVLASSLILLEEQYCFHQRDETSIGVFL